MKKKRKMADFHFGHAWIVGLTHITILWAALHCILTAVRDFFIAQFLFRFKRKKKCVSVDHELDENIPFAPEWGSTYIAFIWVWVSGLIWSRYRFGRKAVPFVVRHINGIRRLYHEAGKVYACCHSTTKRPPVIIGNKTFELIHRADPHLNCVPSLHVMVVAYTAGVIGEDMKESFGEENCQEEVSYFKQMAFSITQSILYVKQHSVNCIPAALFALKHLYPETEREYGEEFIHSLFKDSEPVVKDHHEISRYMIGQYRFFQEQWGAGRFKSFQDVLVEFLFTFTSENAEGGCRYSKE